MSSSTVTELYLQNYIISEELYNFRTVCYLVQISAIRVIILHIVVNFHSFNTKQICIIINDRRISHCAKQLRPWRIRVQEKKEM